MGGTLKKREVDTDGVGAGDEEEGDHRGEEYAEAQRDSHRDEKLCLNRTLEDDRH